jgi:hypothetical protein
MSSFANTDSKTRLLLICGALAGPLFTIIWFVAGLTRAHYDPMVHPISSLSIGELGWTQVTNFILSGLLTLALAVGLRSALKSRGGSKWNVIWVAAIGIGFLGAAAFATDPVNGYPPGTPLLPLQPTVTGRLHRLFSALVFFGIPGAGFSFARFFARNGERTWAAYSRFTAVAFLTMFVIGSLGFAQVELFVKYAGLLQRITLLIGLTWLTLLSIHLLNAPWSSQATGRNKVLV